MKEMVKSLSVEGRGLSIETGGCKHHAKGMANKTSIMYIISLFIYYLYLLPSIMGSREY